MYINFLGKIRLILYAEKEQYIILSAITGILAIFIFTLVFTVSAIFLTYLLMPIILWWYRLSESLKILNKLIDEVKLELKYPFMYNRFIKEG